jgi:Fe(3+) dicitrate transport protein
MDPRFGILYKISDDYNIFTSVHKGFSPPGINGEDAENLNTELGFRFDKGALHGEVIGYYNNFSNLQGSDSMSGGGAGTGDLFNAGAATVKELSYWQLMM